MSLPKRHRPGSKWRVLWWDYKGKGQCGAGHNFYSEAKDKDMLPNRVYAAGPTEFDELVIDEWFHLEMMSDRQYWMRVGALDISIEIGERGQMKSMYVTAEHDKEIYFDEMSK